MSGKSRKQSSSRSRSRSRSRRTSGMSSDHSCSTSRSTLRSSRMRGKSREQSCSRSRSRSRSRRTSGMSREHSPSHSPVQGYKTSPYRHRCSRSPDQSEDKCSRDHRPVKEQLRNISKGSKDGSFSVGNQGGKSLKGKKKPLFYYHHLVDDRFKPPDQDSVEIVEFHGKNRGAMFGSARGTFRGGRGHLGKMHIPGYHRSPDHQEDRSKSPDVEDWSKSPDQEEYSKSPDCVSIEGDGYKDMTGQYRGAMQGTYRGGRGRGYLGKDYIPGYDCGDNPGNNRGMRGTFNPRGGRGSIGSSRGGGGPASTRGLEDKEKGDTKQGKGKKGKKGKKVAKRDQEIKKTAQQRAARQLRKKKAKERKKAKQAQRAKQGKNVKKEKNVKKGKNVKKNPGGPASGQAGRNNQCNVINQTFADVKMLPLNLLPMPNIAPIPNLGINSILNQPQVLPPFMFNPLLSLMRGLQK
ncbi:serine/arginine-rich splicing factor 4-like [Patiria miniata]|uniref:Uncharacterized protein n=1 Tax=Patiria miniata TaxID=46514 RepID=A0A913ZME6_PATMI|nr:serine/arginine-rich splicing factor 4-like [Patiria miniata]